MVNSKHVSSGMRWQSDRSTKLRLKRGIQASIDEQGKALAGNLNAQSRFEQRTSNLTMKKTKIMSAICYQARFCLFVRYLLPVMLAKSEGLHCLCP